jgi:phenylalanyl-tRNA synthetase beta chain
VGASGFAISEVGHAYAGDQPKDETLRAAGIRQGEAVSRQWQGGARAVDVFDAKADAIAVLEACGMAGATLQIVNSAPAWFHPGRSGTLQMGPQNRIAHFGEIHPKVLAEMDVKGPVVAFEIILNLIPAPRQKGTARPALQVSGLMSVSRDFAFVVDDKVQAAELVKAARGVDKVMVTEAQVFDVFRLADGKTSLALEVILQPKDKTFTDEEIEAVAAKIVAAVGKATGATLRS